jgi:putative FmdB family regulatory protein
VPIYEYRCTKCGHRFEAIQKVNDPPLSKCEKCKGKAERLISSPAIQFKGSGWYITDYARKDRPKAEGESAGSSAAKSDAPASGASKAGSSSSSGSSDS